MSDSSGANPPIYHHLATTVPYDEGPTPSTQQTIRTQETTLTQETVAVTAPANLPGGYTFVVQANGKRFPVRVPDGGVRNGEKITAKVPVNEASGTDTFSQEGHTQLPSKAPIGRWKDGTFDCFLVFWQPIFWLSAFFLCHLVALGQVMTRLQLAWNGVPGTSDAVSKTFKILVCATVSIFGSLLLVLIMFPGNVQYEFSQNGMMQPEYYLSPQYQHYRYISNALYYIFTAVILMKTRKYLRRRYGIPETTCFKNMEDCVCSFFCQCCVISQMARHTADYDTYASRCCTSTGLPPNVPTDPFVLGDEEIDSLSLSSGINDTADRGNVANVVNL
mmetsp:Transcript_22508/g.51534  ORF Transcript_22508/g.51534 Transcript_22508/m.51534 type:complete len:333 (-) Transcript_22508:210-1208(-)